MHIFYLTVDRYHEYKINVPPGDKNPGGGISDKTICVLDAWRRYYDVGVGENIEASFDAEILVVEPLWFRLRGGLADLLKSPDLEEAVTAYENHPAKIKIVYTSEFAFIKLPKHYRDRIIGASSVVTTNCLYQKRFFEMLGVDSIQLCDPVDELVFDNSDISKTLSVVAMGKIAPYKNSQKVIEIFNRLGEYPIQRVYIGGSSLWGDTRQEDMKIENEMKAAVDVYHPNLAQRSLAYALAPMACGILDTIHDSCSASNIMMCMNGILCFYGLHGTWEGRPGVGKLNTIQDFVDAIAKKTSNFTILPDCNDAYNARWWALENYSQQAFLEDWVYVREYIKS